MDSRASENVGPGAVLSGAELAVVIPTFNERDNISPLARSSRSCSCRDLVGR